MNRVLIIGDCHGSLENLERVQNKYSDLTKSDYVIVCGDFGFIFRKEKDQLERYHLNKINGYSFTTLFILGNHENFTRFEDYPVEEWHGGRVHKMGKSIFHLMNGEIYEIGEKRFFCFGGAQSPDRAYRVPYKTWWPEEVPTKEEYDNAITNLKEINFSPDYIITHAMPDFFIKELYGGRAIPDKVSFMLNDFLCQCTYQKWYCGHYHIDARIRDNFQICFKRIYEVEMR